MKTAVDWFKEKGVPFDGDITIADIIQIQQDARDAALVEAINLIQRRADDYDHENGWTDMETGTREYPKGGDDYMLELTEIQELIATLRNTTPTANKKGERK